MCGVVGSFIYGDNVSEVNEAALKRIRDQMKSRGPDGEGMWVSEDRRVAFGHRRLAILDLTDAGAQPMFDHTGRYAITFNGEIYNFKTLRAELELAGVRFSSHSDTEVLLQLFIREGPAMLTRLRGMFAFAIWDTKARRLTLARDPYGIKPLYYANANGAFRFASQVKALATHPAISREPSPAGLVGFHLMGSVPEPFTIYRSIKACPAGHWMSVDANGAAEPVKFSSVPSMIVDGARMKPGDIAEALRDSVRHHLIADVEVGAFLSGGIDSGALVGLMRDCGQRHIRAVTLAFEEFDGTHKDESPGAAEIAKLYGVEHHIKRLSSAEVLGDLPAIFDAMDQPSVDGINTWLVSKAMHELGLKVAVSGLGGDELFAGYSTFSSVPWTRRVIGPFARMAGTGRLAKILLRKLAPAMLARNPKLAGLFELSGSWAGTYLLRRAVLLPFELDLVMDNDVIAAGLDELSAVESIERVLLPDLSSDVARVAALEATNYMRNQLLRDTDWASMAHSLEVRVPLVDTELLRSVAPLMAGLKRGDGKAILGNAPSMPLPDNIISRQKTGFSVPTRGWMSGNGAALGRLEGRAWSLEALQRYLASPPQPAV